MKYLENLACKFLIWRFTVGYGADCEDSDLDYKEFKDEIPAKAIITHPSRCASCRAGETIDFLNKHIKL